MSRSIGNLLLTTLLLSATPACLAELADRNKPLYLESDQVLIDDPTKTSTFTGNVQMVQGTMLIRGDKVIVVEGKDGFKRGTVYGEAASFRQKREGLDEYVEGEGERIEYDTRADAVDFYGQARVKRGLDEVRGEHITYNVRTEIFQVSNGGGDSIDSPPKRVRAVLQPKPKNDPQPNKSGSTLTPAE